MWMTRWITLWLDPVRWGLSTVVHENPKPATVFETFVHKAAHTVGLWLVWLAGQKFFAEISAWSAAECGW